MTTVRRLLFVILLVGCAADQSTATSPKPLRVGHLYVNGNCSLDSENKLTGLCMGHGKGGCITHDPDPESPRCQVGLVVNEPSAPACSTTASQELVSREHQCFFVNR